MMRKKKRIPRLSYNTSNVAHFIKRRVPGIPGPSGKGKDDMSFLSKGFFGEFARNPLGTLIGLIMFFVLLDFMASPTLGPFAGYPDFTNDMTLIYNNSNWILTFAFAMLPLALAFAFLSGKPITLRQNAEVPETPEEEVEEPGPGE